ncbi:hypothetical protein Tco_0743471 [Tanacetum coccineum]
MPALTKDHKRNEDQYAVFMNFNTPYSMFIIHEDSGRYQTWSLLQESPIRRQGNGRNQNRDAINDNIRGDVRNVTKNNNRRGCTYKEFLACTPKEYDKKGGVVIRTLGREVSSSFSNPRNRRIERYMYGLDLQIRGIVAATEPSTIQKAVQIADTLTDESIGMRTRTGNAFATTANPVRREYTAYPRLNQAQRPEGNHQNQVMAVNGGQGRRNNVENTPETEDVFIFLRPISSFVADVWLALVSAFIKKKDGSIFRMVDNKSSRFGYAQLAVECRIGESELDIYRYKKRAEIATFLETCKSEIPEVLPAGLSEHGMFARVASVYGIALREIRRECIEHDVTALKRSDFQTLKVTLVQYAALYFSHHDGSLEKTMCGWIRIMKSVDLLIREVVRQLIKEADVQSPVYRSVFGISYFPPLLHSLPSICASIFDRSNGKDMVEECLRGRYHNSVHASSSLVCEMKFGYSSSLGSALVNNVGFNYTLGDPCARRKLRQMCHTARGWRCPTLTSEELSLDALAENIMIASKSGDRGKDSSKLRGLLFVDILWLTSQDHRASCRSCSDVDTVEKRVPNNLIKRMRLQHRDVLRRMIDERRMDGELDC